MPKVQSLKPKACERLLVRPHQLTADRAARIQRGVHVEVEASRIVQNCLSGGDVGRSYR